jgi:hypothetical protein
MPFSKGILKHKCLELHETTYIVHKFQIRRCNCDKRELENSIANKKNLR